MKQRLPLILSSTALLVAVLGATPLGQAAGSVIAAGVPYANLAGFAKNAGRLNGHASSTRPVRGQIPVLNALGKLPASIGAVGPAGPAGAKGDAGPAGPPGASGYEIVTDSVRVDTNDKNKGKDVSCPSGKSVISGGWQLTANAGGDFTVREAEVAPDSNRVWRFRADHATGNGVTVNLRVICATVSS